MLKTLKAAVLGPEAKPLEILAREYIQLKAEAAKCENRMKEIRPALEDHIETEPEKKALVDGIQLSIIDCERQQFDLKAAEKKLGKRALKPFYKPVTSRQLRITYKAAACGA